MSIKIKESGIDIYLEVEKLIQYSIINELIEEEDKILIVNRVLECIELYDYKEFSLEEVEKIKQEVKKVTYPSEILDNITKWASKNNRLKNDTLTYRDLLNSKIMGQILQRTSAVRAKFWYKYEKENREKATDYFYELSKKSNYIRTDRIDKNIHWCNNSKYGDLEITVNLSKPEKDPKEIALAKDIKSSSYPKGLLSKENEGYMGRLDHPGRQNHRTIKIYIDGEEWYMQYSPYTYYNEHCILFSGVDRPMKIDRGTFRRLIEFLEKFPHYFIGSNADLPIVGGSILSHDHFQGGRHIFPMEKAKLKKEISFKGYEDVKASIVDWPLSVIRICGSKDKIIDLSDKILNKWKNYNDESLEIYSHTKNERHNTITPIARYKNGQYEMDLVLRNNKTTTKYPLGIYHPHKEYHNIKKENIGLIEVMGLAVLPGRLAEEMKEIREILEAVMNYESFYKNRSYVPVYEIVGQNEKLEKHLDWIRRYLEKVNIEDLLDDYKEKRLEKIDTFLKNAISDTFCKVLEDCGVFKNDKLGEEGFLKFIKSV